MEGFQQSSCYFFHGLVPGPQVQPTPKQPMVEGDWGIRGTQRLFIGVPLLRNQWELQDTDKIGVYHMMCGPEFVCAGGEGMGDDL